MDKVLTKGYEVNSNGEPKEKVFGFDLSDAGLLNSPEFKKGTYFVRGQAFDFYIKDGLPYGGNGLSLEEAWNQLNQDNDKNKD